MVTRGTSRDGSWALKVFFVFLTPESTLTPSLGPRWRRIDSLKSGRTGTESRQRMFSVVWWTDTPTTVLTSVPSTTMD